MRSLPDLSRFEMECLRLLWSRGEATIRQVHGELAGEPGYNTVRKIFERLEEKGAVKRSHLEGRAWVYRSRVSPAGMIRKEIQRLLNTFFDGAGTPLVSHLIDMEAVSLADLETMEKRLRGDSGTGSSKGPGSQASRPSRKASR